MSSSTETNRPAPSKGETRALQTARTLLAELFMHYSDHHYVVRLWNGQTIPPDSTSEPDFTLTLTHPAI